MNCWQRFTSAAMVGWAVVVGGAGSAAAQAKPEGEMRFALYVTVAPAWLDPAEAGPGFATPFWIMYGLHDALVKPMPGNPMAPSLAESWTESPDRLVYEVQPDGTLANGKVFFDMTSAEGEDALDGMKVDQKGNLYVSGPGGLWIISPEGKHMGTIVGPEHPHNFAWGDDDGKTLYLCAKTGLYRIRLNIPGIRP